MFATFAIEIALALYTIIRYHMSPLTRVITATLVLLATFQFSEFFVCETNNTVGLFSRLGYAAITMLPPLGIHLVSMISGRGSKRLTAAAYTSGILFILFLAFSPTAFDSYVCGGNYAVFHLVHPMGSIFFVYYYFWLFVGIFQCINFAKTAAPKIRLALTYQAYGYLSFVLPTGIVNMLNPESIYGIPSIMCGFAAIYAILLAFGITPLVLQSKKNK